MVSCEAERAGCWACSGVSDMGVPVVILKRLEVFLDESEETGTVDSFSVTVEVDVDGGAGAALVAATPSGINPQIKFLELKIEPTPAPSRSPTERWLAVYAERPPKADYRVLWLAYGDNAIAADVILRINGPEITPRSETMPSAASRPADDFPAPARRARGR